MSLRTITNTPSTERSSTASEAPFLTPTSTPSDTPHRVPSIPGHYSRRDPRAKQNMDDVQQDQAAAAAAADADPSVQEEAAPAAPEEKQPDGTQQVKTTKKKSHRHKPGHKKQKAVSGKGENKKTTKDSQESESDSSSSDDHYSDDSDSSSSSQDERAKRKARKHKKAKKASKDKKKRKSRKAESDSSGESDSDSDSDVPAPSTKRKKKTTRKSKKVAESDDADDGGSDDAATGAANLSSLQAQLDAFKLTQMGKKQKLKLSPPSFEPTKTKTKTIKKSSDGTDYKRVDRLWDKNDHTFKLSESNEDKETEFSEYAFLVRRCFTWENQYTYTMVDIKSKELRAVLAEVMKDCKSVSLEAEEPSIEPNTLFLYLEELRTYYKKTLKAKIKTEKKRKIIKKLEVQRKSCKTLVSYIDEDFAGTKKTLYPLIEAGNITFDLLWGLFKPNEIVITQCYGSWDEARCFKVEYANKHSSMTRGEWWCIEGTYLEYDGKNFGFGTFEVDIDSFKGPRKISSLAAYPIKYHADPEGIKKKIVERGEKFVQMEGMQYKFHKGLAFMKKKRQVAKININGRIMVDPETFRRINPNYPISLIKPKESEELFSFGTTDDSDCSCSENDDTEEEKPLINEDHSDYVPKYKYKWVEDEHGCTTFVRVEVDENGNPIHTQRIEALETIENRSYTEEELLLTSPVVLGFAFSEKLWLEFSISGVTDITYNEDAFDSLVLPNNQKDIVRALVESHKFNAAKTIDDVVQGKGKGLVSVLHGPPGTGKTLTAEGISELLKCPLYMVSAGELGTDPARLEHELQKILDIAHSWGAVLLLDEADVFLEKREVHDIHRNALVSIFLRLLEYFQGILFLTTNRVATFDEAFSSRIHLPLKYDNLTSKAKKAVWKQFIDMVRSKDNTSVAEFTDSDLDMLSRHDLNGRQIKNAVRTAQALALREKKLLDMEHVKKVLDVNEDFDRDLKGGTGYVDAMRSYT